MSQVLSLTLWFLLQTATLYPGVVFGICFVLNCFIWGKHSSGAVGATLSLGPAGWEKVPGLSGTLLASQTFPSG